MTSRKREGEAPKSNPFLRRPKMSDSTLMFFERICAGICRGAAVDQLSHLQGDWFAGRAMLGLPIDDSVRGDTTKLMTNMVRGAALMSLISLSNPNNPHAIELVLANIKIDAILPLYEMVRTYKQAQDDGHSEAALRACVDDLLTAQVLRSLSISHCILTQSGQCSRKQPTSWMLPSPTTPHGKVNARRAQRPKPSNSLKNFSQPEKARRTNDQPQHRGCRDYPIALDRTNRADPVPTTDRARWKRSGP